MMLPIRCFTCGKLLGNKYQQFQDRVKAGEEPAKALDALGLDRYCCRSMVLSSVEFIDQVLTYYEAQGRREEVTI